MIMTLTGAYGVLGIAGGNAIGGASVLAAPASMDFIFVATPWFGMPAPAPMLQPRAGVVRLLSNDITTDSDGDGLGDSLEAALGMCPGPTACGVTCPTPTTCFTEWPNPVDSDRDGLRDDEEVFGVLGTLPYGLDDLPLARWGADPLHKDVFVEVDYLYDLKATSLGLPPSPPLQVGMNQFEWIRDHPGVAFGAWTSSVVGWGSGTLADWVAVVTSKFAVGPNAHLHNPDEQPWGRRAP